MKYKQTWQDCFIHHQTQKDVIIARVLEARRKAKYNMQRWNELYTINSALYDEFWKLSDEYHAGGDKDVSLVTRMNEIHTMISKNSDEMDICWKVGHGLIAH